MGVTVATAAPRGRPMPRILAVLGTALEAAWSHRVAWLFGAAAFMLRGGIFVLLAPLIVVPSPVEIRLMIGGNLGTTGFSPALLVAILAFAIAMTLLLMLVLYAISWLELWSFQRVARTPLAAGVDERKVVSRVFSIQAGGLSALALATIPLAISAINVSYRELVSPTGTGPLYDRIVSGVQGPLLLLVAAIVIVEAVSAVLSRRVLAQEFRIAPAGGRRWRPLVAAVGWLVTLGALLPSLWALNLAATSVKQTLAGFESPDLAAVAVALLGLGLAWALAIVLTGFSSALRGALWTVQELG
jgi:hypothetical protein